MTDQQPAAAAARSADDRPVVEYPMTAAARRALDGEVEALTEELRVAQDAGVPLDDDGIPQPDSGPGLPVPMQAARLAQLQEVLERARVVEEPGLAVIGRTVTAREPEGDTMDYELVTPGNGDPRTGRVSVDSPVGSAILGRRAGDEVEVEAPAGRRSIVVISVDDTRDGARS